MDEWLARQLYGLLDVVFAVGWPSRAGPDGSRDHQEVQEEIAGPRCAREVTRQKRKGT